ICLGVNLEPDERIKDSGCSKHMTGNRKLFSTYKAYNGGNVIFGSNLHVNIVGKGNKPKDQIFLTTIDENSTLWHRILGHPNMHLIQSLASKELVRNLPKLKFDQHFYDACKIGKQAHASHKAKNVVSTTRCLELLHMDLFGPSAIRSYGENCYTLVIVDDYSRPDIMFSVCLCARFQEAPKTFRLKAVKRIFRYIKGTAHLGLWYPKGTGIETVVYADSDHAGDYVDRKITSGIYMFVGCCLTSWFLKKQTALAISTTEAEYVSVRKACQQALWMKQTLTDYDVRLDDVPIMCDNEGAIGLSNTRCNILLVDKAFDSQIRQNIEVYVDDLVVKSYTKAKMLRDIDETFRTLRKINMKLNPKKCTFGAAGGVFLGYVVTPEGIKPCPDKIAVVLQLPSPRTIKQVQSLNGKLASLNRFLSKSAEKYLPLFRTLKKCIKKSDFHWTAEVKQAFKQLKQHLSELPQLVAPRPNEELIIYLSATYGAISAFAASNNEAEYEALIAGLWIATQMGVQNVHAVVPYAVVKMCWTALGKIHRPVTRNPQQPLTPITAPWPFYKWGIDIVGPLIVAMDYFTKWIEVKAVATITGGQVRGVTFRPGDFIYRSNNSSHAVAEGKLRPKWKGPYEVTEALGDGAYKL
nr:reverse transcriptase domain-containing protein [Tanacetum cinerariifolium]